MKTLLMTLKYFFQQKWNEIKEWVIENTKPFLTIVVCFVIAIGSIYIVGLLHYLLAIIFNFNPLWMFSKNVTGSFGIFASGVIVGFGLIILFLIGLLIYIIVDWIIDNWKMAANRAKEEIANEPCGNLLPFTNKELKKNKPDIAHYCGLLKGHEGSHKCLYTNCRKRW